MSHGAMTAISLVLLVAAVVWMVIEIVLAVIASGVSEGIRRAERRRAMEEAATGGSPVESNPRSTHSSRG